MPQLQLKGSQTKRLEEKWGTEELKDQLKLARDKIHADDAGAGGGNFGDLASSPLKKKRT